MVIQLGCTPIHYFDCPYAAGEIAVLNIAYSYGGDIVLEKSKKDCTIADGRISAKLTQEDTLKFPERAKIAVQVRIRLTSGDAVKSDVMYATTDELLKDGVI